MAAFNAVVTMEQIRASGTQPWKLNNTALKWLRDTHENPPGIPTVPELDLTSQEEIMIQTLVEPGGQDYSFTAPPTAMVMAENAQWLQRGELEEGRGRRRRRALLHRPHARLVSN